MADTSRIEAPDSIITEEMVAEDRSLAAAYYSQQLGILVRGGAVWIQENFQDPNKSGNALYFRAMELAGFIRKRRTGYFALAVSDNPDILRSLVTAESLVDGYWPTVHEARTAVENAHEHPLRKP